MPIIIFESGILTKDVKQELIEQLTNTAAAVTKIPKEYFINSPLGNHIKLIISRIYSCYSKC